MPSDERDQTPSQADRLNRKIERLLSGQPVPVLDGDTEELAEIARQLMLHLEKGQPDPGFREQLLQDLVAPGPRPVPFRPRSRPRRYPVPALLGALSIVLIASAATGWMALAPDAAGLDDDAVNQVARFASSTPTAAASGTALMAASSLTVDPRRTETANTNQPDDAGGAAQDSAPDGGPPLDDPAQSEPNNADATEQAATQQLPAVDSTQAVVELPPVDAGHVELGALATVAAPADDALSGVRMTLQADLSAIELEPQALAYYFSAPFVDANLILRSVGDFLGVEAVVDRRESAGRTVYSLTNPDGGVNFTWSPDSGAFACTLPDAHSAADIEDLSNSAIEWLKAFGYPIDAEQARPIIETRDDGQRFVHVPLGDLDLPDPAIGHPMRITLVVDPEGRIVSVSGYWLEVTRETAVSIVSAEQAWAAVQAGTGYWPGSTAPSGPGEFVADAFEVSYMLTSGDVQQELTLQPVIAVSGAFHPDDGSTPYQTTVYVQGAPSV
jgi:hypothetical protein